MNTEIPAGTGLPGNWVSGVSSALLLFFATPRLHPGV